MAFYLFLKLASTRVYTVTAGKGLEKHLYRDQRDLCVTRFISIIIIITMDAMQNSLLLILDHYYRSFGILFRLKKMQVSHFEILLSKNEQNGPDRIYDTLTALGRYII